jgi:hypothetical protein
LALLELSERNAAYAAMGAAAFAAGVSLMATTTVGSLASVGLAALGGLGIALSYFLFSFGFMAMPFITKFLHVSEDMGGGYRIPPTQDAVVRNFGGAHQATIFMSAKFYEAGANEGESQVSAAYMELWERALSGVRFPFKYCLITYLEDMAKYREDIETKRYAATLKLGKEREKPNPDALTIDKYEREVARMNAMLTRLAEGEKPMGAVMYAATMGIGAIEAARRQVSEVRSSVANSLNVEIKALKGEDLRRCFMWEHYVPPDMKEFLSQL